MFKKTICLSVLILQAFTFQADCMISLAKNVRPKITSGITTRASALQRLPRPIKAIANIQSLTQQFGCLTVSRRMSTSGNRPQNESKRVLKTSPNQKFQKRILTFLEKGFFTQEYLKEFFLPTIYDKIIDSIMLIPHHMGSDQTFADELYTKALQQIKDYRGKRDAIHPLFFSMLLMFSPQCKQLFEAAAVNIDHLHGQEFAVVFETAYRMHKDSSTRVLYERRLTQYTSQEEFDTTYKECVTIIQAALKSKC